MSKITLYVLSAVQGFSWGTLFGPQNGYSLVVSFGGMFITFVVLAIIYELSNKGE